MNIDRYYELALSCMHVNLTDAIIDDIERVDEYIDAVDNIHQLTINDDYSISDYRLYVIGWVVSSAIINSVKKLKADQQEILNHINQRILSSYNKFKVLLIEYTLFYDYIDTLNKDGIYSHLINNDDIIILINNSMKSKYQETINDFKSSMMKQRTGDDKLLFFSMLSIRFMALHLKKEITDLFTMDLLNDYHKIAIYTPVTKSDHLILRGAIRIISYYGDEIDKDKKWIGEYGVPIYMDILEQSNNEELLYLSLFGIGNALCYEPCRYQLLYLDILPILDGILDRYINQLDFLREIIRILANLLVDNFQWDLVVPQIPTMLYKLMNNNNNNNNKNNNNNSIKDKDCRHHLARAFNGLTSHESFEYQLIQHQVPIIFPFLLDCLDHTKNKNGTICHSLYTFGNLIDKNGPESSYVNLYITYQNNRFLQLVNQLLSNCNNTDVIDYLFDILSILLEWQQIATILLDSKCLEFIVNRMVYHISNVNQQPIVNQQPTTKMILYSSYILRYIRRYTPQFVQECVDQHILVLLLYVYPLSVPINPSYHNCLMSLQYILDTTNNPSSLLHIHHLLSISNDTLAIFFTEPTCIDFYDYHQDLIDRLKSCCIQLTS